jgi:hypothetical protein
MTDGPFGTTGKYNPELDLTLTPSEGLPSAFITARLYRVEVSRTYDVLDLGEGLAHREGVHYILADTYSEAIEVVSGWQEMEWQESREDKRTPRFVSWKIISVHLVASEVSLSKSVADLLS